MNSTVQKVHDTKLGALPESWSVGPLVLAASNERDSFVDGPFGSNLKTSDYTSEGVRLIQLQNIGEGEFLDNNIKYTSVEKAEELRRHIARPGDIVIAKMAEPIARACFVPSTQSEWLIVADCIKLTPKTQDFDLTFLLSVINSDVVRSQALAHSTGTTRRRIGLSELRKLLIPIPSLTEQRQISTVLSSIDEALEASKAVLEQIKSSKEGVLQHLFAYGAENPKDLDQHLPHSWELLNLNELGKGQVVRTGPFGSSLKTEHFSATGTPVITIGSLGEGVIERVALMFVPDAKAKELEAYKVKEGDLVFSRVADVGRSVRIGRDEADWLMSSNLIRIRVDLSRFNTQFLMYAITRSSFVGRQIKRLTSGGGRAVVTSAVLSELMFAMPTLEEQNEIVSILDSFDEDYHALEAKCCQLDILKRALMQQLLTGKLRVAVDDG